MGGLPRRATFIDEQRAASEATFVADGGGLFWRSARLAESEREATLLKADLIAQSYALSGVDAVGIGPNDLALGWTDVHRIMSEHELPVLAANLTCDGEKPFPASRVVERGGVKLGFVGAYVGALPPEAASCTVEDPQTSMQAAVAALEPVDVVLALGSWDAKQAEALVTAVPAVDFVVSASNLTLPTGRALSQDDWLLAAGSRGKKMGLLEATLVPGASGWQAANPGASQADRLDSYRKRLASNQERLASAQDEKAKQRAQRQISFYEKEIAKIEAELAAATAHREVPANRFDNELVALTTKVADQAATLELVTKTKAELEAKGLAAPEAAQPQRVELAPDGQRPILPGGKPGALPLGIKARRMGSVEVDRGQVPDKAPVEPPSVPVKE